MAIVFTHSAAIDCHKKSLTVHRVIPGAGALPQHDTATFGTTTAEVLRLADWLAAGEVTHVAMESTGVYTLLIMLQRWGFLAWGGGGCERATAEDDPHLVLINFHSLDQGPNQLALRTPVRLRESGTHGRRKRLQPFQHTLQFHCFPSVLLLLRQLLLDLPEPLAQPPHARFKLPLLDHPRGIAIDQAPHPLPQFTHLRFQRRDCAGLLRRFHPALIFGGHALGFLQYVLDFLPDRRIQPVQA